MEKGGLGLGSIKAFNLALILKWRWRMSNNPDVLWVRILKSIHGENDGLDEKGCKTQGVWAKIVGTINHLQSSGIVSKDTLKYKVGCGSSIRFWKDNWHELGPVQSRYYRLSRTDSDIDCVIRDRLCNGVWTWNWRRNQIGARNKESLTQMMEEIGPMHLISDPDKCIWTMSIDGVFTVGTSRQYIDDHLLLTLPTPTTWNATLPKKVNIFMRHILLKRLPTRVNLSSCGLEINSILCPLCGITMETNEHLFFSCKLVEAVWSKVRVWCNGIVSYIISSEEWRR